MATLANQDAATQKIFNDTWGSQAGAQWAAEDAKNHPAAATAQPQVQNPQLQDGLNKLQAAVAAGDQKSYDLALAQIMGVFNGQPTLEAQKQKQAQDLAIAQLLGTYNGQQTLGSQQLGLDTQKLGEQSREFNLSQGQDLLKTGASLQSPQDWGKYLQYTSGGKNLYQQAMGGRPASGAPVGENQPQTLQSLMAAFGMGGAPGASGAAAGQPNASQQALYRQLMGVAANYSPSTMYTPADVQASGGYANAKAQNFATYGGKDPLGGGGDGGGGVSPEQQTYRQLMGNAPDYSPDTMYTPDEVRGSGGYQNALAGNFATFGGKDPLAGMAPTTPAAPAAAPNFPAPTGINSFGQSADNQQLLSSLGFGAPNLSQVDIQRLSGAPGATGINDVLSSPTYRGFTSGQGEPTDVAAQQVQDYEQKLQSLNNPGAMNPAFWDSLGKDGQAAWLGAAQQIFGWTPEEYMRQINATRPLGSPYAPQTVRTRYNPIA